MEQITCIIPSYNEAPRIGNVLNAIKGHPSIREIVVVDDGSKDSTTEVVSRFKGVRLISFRRNKGKAAAMVRGAEAAKTELIMFLDADLVGLTKKDITSLITPVRQKKVEITMSRRDHVGSCLSWMDLVTRLIRIGPLSGERVMRKNLFLKMIRGKKKTGFGVETLVNEYIIKHRIPFAVVDWKRVKQNEKFVKRGFWKGIKMELVMCRQILRAIPLHKLVVQFALLALRNNKF
ncbi:glycosyltransferase [Candidatus Woesearchaeota archaeon]|nr:glycosyltransferase [Candidatus Woesearchaeota archaeon]